MNEDCRLFILEKCCEVVHIVCECEALTSLSHTQLGSFFLYPEDMRKLIIGAVWNFTKGKGLLLVQNMAHKGPVLRPRCIGPWRARTQIPSHSIQFMSTLTSAAVRSFRRVGNVQTGEIFRKRLNWELKNRDLMVYKV